MIDSAQRNNLQGIGRTLLTLADGLARSGFIDPGESPSALELLKELATDVRDVDTGHGVDSRRLPLLVLQVVRIAEVCGVAPTVATEPDGPVTVETTDVQGGLELLQQVSEIVGLELRGVATAISILVDYAFVVVQPTVSGSEQSLDAVKLTRGALAIAEISVRNALEDGMRGKIAVGILRRCADNIEAEETADEDEDDEQGDEADSSG